LFHQLFQTCALYKHTKQTVCKRKCTTANTTFKINNQLAPRGKVLNLITAQEFKKLLPWTESEGPLLCSNSMVKKSCIWTLSCTIGTQQIGYTLHILYIHFDINLFSIFPIHLFLHVLQLKSC
jgi:hypothetical protein